jgi:enterobactin synthetase component D
VHRSAYGAPLWPPGFVGSITHTEACAYAAVAPQVAGFGVGIDSECVVDELRCRDVLQRACGPAERAWIGASKDPLLAATLLFCAKESLYKAIHRQARRLVDFDEVALWPPGAAGEGFRLQPAYAPPGAGTGVLPLFAVTDRVVHAAVEIDAAAVQAFVRSLAGGRASA